MQENATARPTGDGPRLRLAGPPGGGRTAPAVRAADAIWIDERNPILRRGIAACVQSVGYRIAGESTRLSPAPDLARASVLVFDVEASGIDRASALARSSDVRLVGLLRQPPRDVLDSRLAAALLLRTLTPARLVSCLDAVSDGPDRASVRELADGFARRREVAARSGAELTGREITVLRLLAAGDSTRDIATRLRYSERTVKNIVHDVLSKLGGRTRAHAVALAVRDGVI